MRRSQNHKKKAKNCAEVKRMERRLLCKQQTENNRIQTWTQENQKLDNDHQVAVKEETDKTHGKTMLLSRKRQENDKTMTRK
jgi:hypothetical protein